MGNRQREEKEANKKKKTYIWKSLIFIKWVGGYRGEEMKDEVEIWR